MASDPDLADLVREHVAAFNAQDVERLEAGLTADVLWETGTDVFAGAKDVAALIRNAMTELAPSLEIRSIVSGTHQVAAELIEHWRYDDADHSAPVGVFYSFIDGRISRVRVYREGSADP